MNSTLQGIATDSDFVFLYPPYTNIIKPFYNTLRKLSNYSVEKMLSIAGGGMVEYSLEGIFFNSYNPIFTYSKPIVTESVLARTIEKYKIGIFSRRYLLKDLRKLGLEKYFYAIVGREKNGINTDRRTYIDRCVKELDVSPSNCLVVSDSPKDLVRAKEIGTLTAGVLSGYHSKNELREIKPDILIRSLQKLLTALSDSNFAVEDLINIQSLLE